ncbi:hypothetical protein [Streptomyces sp. MNP-20]|nr:hypothetical protein [Streptomyces sp. MNP-20]
MAPREKRIRTRRLTLPVHRLGEQATVVGADGTDVCDAETETACEG